MSSLESQTSIAAHTKVVGDIGGQGDLILFGTCKGEVQIQGRVLVQEQGVLKGNVDAQEIEVQGVVLGELRAQVSISLGPKARVVGALIAPRIEVLQGAQFQGPLKSQVPQALDTKRAHRQEKRDFTDAEITAVAVHQELQIVAACAS